MGHFGSVPDQRLSEAARCWTSQRRTVGSLLPTAMRWCSWPTLLMARLVTGHGAAEPEGVG